MYNVHTYIYTLDECGGVGGGGGSTLHVVGSIVCVPHTLALVHKRKQE